jgi:hypothetical protein
VPPVRADMGIVKWVLREIMDARTGGLRCRGPPVFLWMLAYSIGDRRMTPEPPLGFNPANLSRLSAPPLTAR